MITPDKLSKEQLQVMPKISEAIRTKDLHAVEKLFQEYPEQLGFYTFFGKGTWLHFASGEGNVDMVRLIHNLGVDINTGDYNDNTLPLIDAVSCGKVENVKYLLEHGSILDTSESVRNPLFAVSSGASHTLQMEIREKRKIDPTATADYGNDPRFLEITKLLLDAGIDASVSYHKGRWHGMDAMGFAWMWGERKIARLIAEHLAGGDKEKIEALLAKADQTAEAHTEEPPENLRP